MDCEMPVDLQRDLWVFESESDVFRRSDLLRMRFQKIPLLFQMNNGWIISKQDSLLSEDEA